jgi:hypothetical protein
VNNGDYLQMGVYVIETVSLGFNMVLENVLFVLSSIVDLYLVSGL